jgi:hypothetical protein
VPLTAFGKKRLNDGSTFGGEDTGGNFDLMVETGIGKDLEAAACRTAFGIVRAINESRDTRLNYCSSAHTARFDCHIKSSAREAVVPKAAGGFTKDNDFCVRRRVIVANGAVAGTRHNPAAVDEHGSDGNFTGSSRGACLGKSFLHESEVGIRHGTENNMQN